MMTGFEQYTRKTRRAIFLEEMEQVEPWRELCAEALRTLRVLKRDKLQFPDWETK